MGLSEWSPSASMQSARHGSHSSVVICSSPPFRRPRAAVARIASVRVRRLGEATFAGAADLVERGAVIVGKAGDQRLELVVGHRRECPVEQRQALQAVLHLVHRQSRLPGQAGTVRTSMYRSSGMTCGDEGLQRDRRDVVQHVEPVLERVISARVVRAPWPAGRRSSGCRSTCTCC